VDAAQGVEIFPALPIDEFAGELLLPCEPKRMSEFSYGNNFH
jgi:hypothetical protein